MWQEYSWEHGRERVKIVKRSVAEAWQEHDRERSKERGKHGGRECGK